MHPRKNENPSSLGLERTKNSVAHSDGRLSNTKPNFRFVVNVACKQSPIAAQSRTFFENLEASIQQRVRAAPGIAMDLANPCTRP
jgi:hypothetical protein